MRAIFGVAMVMAIVTSSSVAADIDGAKLVGKWNRVGAKVKATTEFTADGKMITIIEAKGKEIKSEATYKLDGDKLTIKTKDRETVSTITKLTDDDLIMESQKPKRKDELKRAR